MGWFDDIWNRAAETYEDAEEEADRLIDEARETASSVADNVSYMYDPLTGFLGSEAARDATRNVGETMDELGDDAEDRIRSLGAAAGDGAGEVVRRSGLGDLARDTGDQLARTADSYAQFTKWGAIGVLALAILITLAVIGYFFGPVLIAGLSRWETVV